MTNKILNDKAMRQICVDIIRQTVSWIAKSGFSVGVFLEPAVGIPTEHEITFRVDHNREVFNDDRDRFTKPQEGLTIAGKVVIGL